MNSENLPGSLKAAVLLKTLDSEAMNAIMVHFSPQEREKVIGDIQQIGDISNSVIEKVSEEFTSLFKQRSRTDVAKKPPVKMPGTRAKKDPRKSGKLEAIQSIDPDKLYGLIKDEHPQTMAVILAHLKPHSASEVLSKMPDEIKNDVAIRIAGLDKVKSKLVDELDKMFEEILGTADDADSHKTGGVDLLAEILNQSSDAAVEQLLSEIEELEPELAVQIKQRMFIFEDLVLVDDRGMQQVFRKVESKELALALKAASDEVKEKVFKNMSGRAGDMLMEEIESLGPIRMSDVEAAQGKITGIIQSMEAKGEIVISGRGGDDYIA